MRQFYLQPWFVCAVIGNLELPHNVPRNEVIINNWEN